MARFPSFLLLLLVASLSAGLSACKLTPPLDNEFEFELVFEDDSDLDGDTGMATQELDVETLVDEPEEAAPAARRSSASARPAKRTSPVAAAVAATTAASSPSSRLPRSAAARSRTAATART